MTTVPPDTPYRLSRLDKTTDDHENRLREVERIQRDVLGKLGQVAETGEGCFDQIREMRGELNHRRDVDEERRAEEQREKRRDRRVTMTGAFVLGGAFVGAFGLLLSNGIHP